MNYLLPTLVYGTITILATTTYFSSPESGLYSLGLVAGITGVQILWWQVALGIRQISTIFSEDLINLNSIHKNLGKYGFLFIAIHPVIMYATYGIPPVHPTGYTYILIGSFAFTILLLIWVLSALARKRITWRRWKQIHLLAYPALALIFFHSANLQLMLSQSTLLNIWWKTLGVTFGFMALYRLVLWAGIGKSRYKVISKKVVADNVTEYGLRIVKGRQINPKKGQFVYLQPDRFKESHPFTASDHKDQVIKLSIKSSGKFTKNLAESISKDDEVYLDGPYGVYTKEMADDDSAVVIAGGIGITPFLRWIQEGAPQKLFYANRTSSDIAYKGFIDKKVNAIHVLSNEEKSGYEHGYVDADMISKYLDGEIDKYNYYLCGPPPMMDSVQKGLMEKGVDKSKIRTEKFSL